MAREWPQREARDQLRRVKRWPTGALPADTIRRGVEQGKPHAMAMVRAWAQRKFAEHAVENGRGT